MRPLYLRAWIVLALGLAAASDARAQDVRDIRPAVMLLVDTSGSMELKPDCDCVPGSCSACYPDCAAGERSKWNMVLEALTGPWTAFSCSEQARTFGEYDYPYMYPHFTHPTTAQGEGLIDTYRARALFGLMTYDAQPNWSGSVFDPVPAGSWNESYSDGERGHYSYGDAKEFDCDAWYCLADPYTVNLGARYGGTVGPLISTGTGDPAVNDAVEAALLGNAPYTDLRPWGGSPLAAMLSDYEYYLGNHPDVQPGSGDPLQACRPRYAVVITDGRPYLDMRGSPIFCENTTLGCPYPRPEEIVAALCNAENGVCTGDVDGVFVVGVDIDASDTTMRAELDDLADVGGTGQAYFATTQAELVAKLDEVLSAMELAAPGVAVSSRTPPVFTNARDGFHAQYNSGYRQVEGGAWEGILERQRFECTSSLVPEAQSMAATDRFHEVISAQTTRNLYTVVPSKPCAVRGHLTGVVPALAPLGFSSTGSGSGRGGGRSGRGGANDSCGNTRGGNPHSTTRCPTPPATEPTDAYVSTGCNLDSGPLDTLLELSPFARSNGALKADYFFVGNGQGANAERNDIIDWVRGETRTNDLGAIQHSTPVVVGKPEVIADESHNLFRRQPDVAGRPVVLYFGTSDGILHAVSAKDQQGTIAGVSYNYRAGEELWGFVPPVLLPNLAVARTGHHPMMDGTPVVRDIFVQRLPGATPDPSIYRTILISGFRGGGAGYFALDVTNPRDPKFLWQFSHPELGYSYGQPAIAQVVLEVQSNGTTHIEERAVALLPGGSGDDLSAGLGCNKCYVCNGVAQLEAPTTDQIASGECVLNEPLGCPSNGIGTPPANNGTIHARDNMRCWGTQGRQLFFVDPATGELIGHLDDSVFGAPLVGGISVFPGETGTVATSAYTTDAEGVIWRIDISSPNMRDWSAAPLFDMFWGEGAASGQPAFEAPIVTTDPLGNVVVIQATGNLDSYDALTVNKVVSITERFSVSSQVTMGSGTTPGSVNVALDGAQIGADLNWQLTLRPSEQVTGPLSLFDGQVFFSTFNGMPDPGNACAVGESRIWGVHYIDHVDPQNPPAGQGDPGSECITTESITVAGQTQPSRNLVSGVLWPVGAFTDAGNTNTRAGGRCLGPYENLLVLGTQVAQRPTCFTINPDDPFDDPFIPGSNDSRTRVPSSGGGTFELVAVTGGGTPLPGASLSQMTRQIEVPLAYTRPTGAYAGRAD